jgi:hypothetical protein
MKCEQPVDQRSLLHALPGFVAARAREVRMIEEQRRIGAYVPFAWPDSAVGHGWADTAAGCDRADSAIADGVRPDEDRLAPVLHYLAALSSHDLVRVARAVEAALRARQAGVSGQDEVEPRIEIDQRRRAREVAQITHADYFRYLHDRAGELRRAHHLAHGTTEFISAC